MPEAPARTFTFRARHRLSHAREFQAVYGGRARKARGPITLYALPNERHHPRLGLSVGRRCGPAVMRNTIKRRLREAFRLSQHDLPTIDDQGYDFIVAALPHEPMSVEDYTRALRSAADDLHREWSKRRRRST